MSSDNNKKDPKPVKPRLPIKPQTPNLPGGKPQGLNFKPGARFQSINRSRR